ncbi:MAG: ArsC family reductase [Chromatiaceae bacterium]|nr:ArsC family reductase [Chromatiaceae bacterium]MBP8290943.1 ArsC family reductase [Chromatiaceae bacterium]MBP9603702.1 ArsC family reductase [Chromatiaceae bacterium]
MIRLFGIPNCETMKKARRWLDARGIAYDFHDYKKQGLDETQLRTWVAELGWGRLINRQGMMWRKLPVEVREGLDEAGAIRVMLATPSIIRRPLLDTGKARHLGFSEAAYAEIFPS